MEGFLDVLREGSALTVALGDRTVIGRLPDNQVALTDDPLVSRTHAVVERYASGWAVRDLGTLNGTYVNERKVLTERVLRPGDEIRVGNSRLVYHSQRAADTGATIQIEDRMHITVLFTDMVSSTERFLNAEPAVADEIRRRHFTLLRQAISDTRGHEVKNLGDGVMAVLPSAPASLACASAMQSAVRRDGEASGTMLGLRVGVSCGEVTHEGDDYFGTAVIEAARLCAKAEAGQILISEALRALADRKTVRDHGQLELKGFSSPVRVYEMPWRAPAEERSG